MLQHFPPVRPQQISPIGPHDWVNARLQTFLQPRVPHLSLFFFWPSFCAAPNHLFFYHQKRCPLFTSATLSASHLSVSCTAVHMCISFHGQWNHHNNRQPNFSTQFHLKHEQNKKKKGQICAVHKVLQWRKWFSMELAMQVISLYMEYGGLPTWRFSLPFICLFVFRLPCTNSWWWW